MSYIQIPIAMRTYEAAAVIGRSSILSICFFSRARETATQSARERARERGGERARARHAAASYEEEDACII